MSVVAPTDPASVAIATVPPEAVNGFPLTSTSCTVTTDVLDPSATTEAGAAVIVDAPGSAAPATNATDTVSVAATAFTMNDTDTDTDADPTTVGDDWRRAPSRPRTAPAAITPPIRERSDQ